MCITSGSVWTCRVQLDAVLSPSLFLWGHRLVLLVPCVQYLLFCLDMELDLGKEVGEVVANHLFVVKVGLLIL